MTDHLKANDIAENAILRLVARVCMAVGVPLLLLLASIILNWIGGISDAQEGQRTFQATQQIEMTTLKERMTNLEINSRAKGEESNQILQRLVTVETLMKSVEQQGTETKTSIDNLTQQLIRERRSDTGEIVPQKWDSKR